MVKRGPSNYDYVNTWLQIKQAMCDNTKRKRALTCKTLPRTLAESKWWNWPVKRGRRSQTMAWFFERSVQKSVFHAQLQQLRDSEDMDDMGSPSSRRWKRPPRNTWRRLGFKSKTGFSSPWHLKVSNTHTRQWLSRSVSLWREVLARATRSLESRAAHWRWLKHCARILRNLDETEKQTECTKKVREPFSGYDIPVSQVGEDTATDPPSGGFFRQRPVRGRVTGYPGG